MDIIDVMQAVAITTLSVVLYVIIFHKNGRQKIGKYSVPNWNFFIKKRWAAHQLRKKQSNKPNFDSQFHNYKSEHHSQAASEQNNRSHMIFGSDENDNSLLLNIVKGKENKSEVWLILRLKNGSTYTLPDHPNVTTTSSVFGEQKFEAAGLTFECLVPYLNWRITYAGLLRRGVRSTWSSNVADEELEFVKFNFFWKGSGQPKHWPCDWSINLRATALATDPWRNGQSTPEFGGYDQFGALYGQIHLSSQPSEQQVIELNMPGVRQWRWNSNDAEEFLRNASVVGVCTDGSIYILGAYSLQRNLSQAQFGYIRAANGSIHSIDWTDFHLKNFAEDPLNFPYGITIQFIASGKTYTTSVYCKRTEVAPLVGSVPQMWSGNAVPLETALDGQRGYGVAILKYASRITIPKRNSALPTLVYNADKPRKLLMAYPFTEAEASNDQFAGGKGASLALLNAAIPIAESEGLPYKVPPGFVVTVAALEMQLNKNRHLVELVSRIRSIAYDLAEGSLEGACNETVARFSECPLESEIAKAITEQYEKLVADVGTTELLRVAVRSSAIGEDSEDASSAGQNETFLGLHGLEEVLQAVQKCWASLYTYRSVEYRRQHVQPINAQMAVVVQAMVASDCAGVLFTKHPGNGDPSKVLITANYGLGESVVSGSVDPDTYTIGRNYVGNNFKILDTQIGSKAHSYSMSAGKDQNILQKELSEVDQNQACLSEEQIIRLVKIGVTLEKMYGSPRDIEWGIYENDVYLLQARPITTLGAMSNWEILHEFDSPVMSPDDLFSFANVGEVFPEPITPLSQSVIITTLQTATSRSIYGFDRKVPGIFQGSFSISHHRLTFNIYKIFLLFREKEISNVDKMQVTSISGNNFITPEIHRVSIHRNGISTKFKRVGLIVDAIKGVWRNKAYLARLTKFISGYVDRFSPENLKEFKNHDAALFNAEINFEIDDPDRLEEAFHIHSNTSMVSTLTQLISMIILSEGAKELSTEHYADFGLLLGSCKDIESAEVPAMLDEIVNEIYVAGVTSQFLEVDAKAGVEWLEQNCASASRLFKKFIKRHAHRSIKEFELITETWGMKPELIINMVQATCRHANNVLAPKKQKREMTNAEIIASLRTPKKNSTRSGLARFLSLCKMSVQRREASKSAIIAYIHELRKAYLHLADLLYGEGLLPNRRLLFFLTKAEIADLIGSPHRRTGLVNRAQRRMRLFPSWSELRFNELNAGVLRPINDADDADLDMTEAITGTAVSEGSVTGRACVITSFSEVHLIQAGDILVTHCTDIGWSTYFPILGGVVTELGGLISHGAVVAREYGLPCIVGAVNATRKLKFGDKVTLNASKGILYRVTDGE